MRNIYKRELGKYISHKLFSKVAFSAILLFFTTFASFGQSIVLNQTTEITANSALISGSVTDIPDNSTAVVWFGTLENNMEAGPSGTVTDYEFSIELTGLQASTQYYYQVHITVDTEVLSDISSFTTTCSPENMCEISYSLSDSYGDGWNDNAINVVDVATNEVLATWTINSGSSATGSLSVCNGRKIRFEWVNGRYSDETSYQVYDATDGVIFSGSGSMSSPVTHIACPTCLNLKNLRVTEVTNESATIRWSERGSAQTWNIVVSTTELEQDVLNVSENIITATDSTYSLTGLSSSTEYYVYVRASCSNDDQSEWKSIVFNTRQIPATLPYTYGFEDATENANWTLSNYDQTNKWYIGTAASNGGEKGLYISNDGGTSNSYNTSSTSYVYCFREINLDNDGLYLIEFDWRAYGEGNYDNLKVFLIPTTHSPNLSAGESNGMAENYNTAPSGWMDAGNMSSYNNVSDWQRNSVEKELEAGSYYLVFFWKNDSSSGSNPPAAVDNINIMKITCPTIANLAVADITTESATISWSERGTAQTWNIVVSTTELEQDVLNISEDIITVTDSTYSLTGLSSSTEYYVYVRAFCSDDDQSDWISLLFHTKQIPATLPYACGFEDTTENDNWTLSNGDQTNKWHIGAAASNGGEKGLYISSSNDGSSNNYNIYSTSYVYAYRELNVEEDGLYYISFDWRAYGESYMDVLMTFLVPTTLNPDLSAGASNGMSGNSSNYPGGWINVGNMLLYSNSSDWQNLSAEKELEAGSYYLVFFWKNNGSSGSNPPAAIDNINFMKITCPKITNLAATDITTESATISWNERGSALTWNIVVSTTELEQDVLNISDNIITATDSTYSLTGLSASTDYYVYVRAFCSDDDQSVWKSINFKTRQFPATLPYTCDFENAIENDKWTLENGTQTNKWYIGVPTDSSSDVNTTEGGVNGLYISNDGGASNTYSGTETRVYAYRDILIPDGASDLMLSFDWKAQGGLYSHEFLRVFWLNPDVVTATAGSNPPTVNGVNYDAAGQPGNYGSSAHEHWLSMQSTWQHEEMIISSNQFADMGNGDKIYRLYFHWRNIDRSSQPPAAVDNIRLEQIINPIVATSSASNIGGTSAILSGEILIHGASDIIERGFDYGTDPENLTENITSDDETNDFSVDVIGLDPNTIYYYRAYAYNSNGSGYGEIKSFKTHKLLNGYTYVDLGLPSNTYWAYANVGATYSQDYGNYYAWGEIEPKDTYDWSTYQHCNGSENTLTKYCNNSEYGYNGFTDDLTTLEESDDAANVSMGSFWRMPTHEEMEELYNNCTSTWTSINGVNGRLFTSRINGNSIFMPAAGSHYDSSFGEDGEYGFYGTSSLYSNIPYYSWLLNFYSGNCSIGSDSRHFGISVRAVYRPSPTVATNSSTDVTLTSATLHGRILNIGSSEIIERGFVYGTSRSNLTDTVQSEDVTNDFSVALTGLTNGTTYYYCAYATNSDFTSYGEIKSFSTPNGLLGDHYYVNLGLPSGTMWASTNIGAETPEDYGDYFAWGETEPKEEYNWDTYIYANGTTDEDQPLFTKYCNNSEYGNNGFTDNLTILESMDDAATANWGEEWRMPTKEDFEELFNNSTQQWTEQNGVRGCLITGNNGNSIFLPAAGHRNGTDLMETGADGYYWSSLYDTTVSYSAVDLNFWSSDYSVSSELRSYGLPVRAVYQVEPTVMDIDYEPYNCDFENAEENSNWILNNGRQTNKWHIGSAVNNGGEKSLYISNDFGENYSYNTGSTSYVYAYRKINITFADKYQFDFDRRVRGEGNYDLLRAFLVPDSIHPNLSGGIDNGMSSNYNTIPDGWIDISSTGIMSEQMGWKHSKSKLNIEPGLYYLTFFWKNDGGDGNTPPAAVDNVMVKRLPPFEVTTLVAPRTSTTATLGAEIVFDRETEIIQVGFAYGESESQLVDTLSMAYSENTFTRQLTGLTPQTTYYYQAFAKCDDMTVFGDVVSFRTKSNDTDGIIDNPLTIDNAEEWRTFAEAMQQSENQSTSTYKGFEIYNCGDDTYFKLTADIDLTDCDNTVVDKFSGHLNGDGNTVTIRFNEQLGAATAFNDLENAFVDSLNVLVPASFVVREDVATYGALCLNAKSSAISNCTTEVASEDVKVVSQNSGKFGGIVGNLINSSVVNCTNNLPIELSANSYVWVGGIVGSMEGSYVSRCINNAVIKGVYAGGIVGQILEATMPSNINIGDLFQNPFRDGQMLDAALISNLNAGNVTAQEMAGGMVASIGDGIVVVDKCMNIAEVFATNTGCSFVSIGGIVGYNPYATLTVSNCANYGSFPALSMQMGGLFGNGTASMNKNISVPQFSGVSAEGNMYNHVYATVVPSENDYDNTAISETDDFFDEQVCDLRVDSLRLKFRSRGTGKPTTEMVGSALESSFSTNWTYSAGLYPLPAGIPEDDRTTLARIPIYFQPYNAAAAVMEDFTLPTSISGHGAVTWESSNQNVISISGGTATVTRPDWDEPDVEVTLTATYEGLTKSFVLLVISPKAIPVHTEYSYIESDSVEMGGFFSSNTSGLSYLKEYGFLYSTKPNISDSTKVVSTNLSDEIHEETFNGRYFSYETDGFEPGRSYYYVAFASTADTTTYGEVNRFRTAGPPEVIIRRPIYRGTDYMQIIVDVESDDENEPEMYLYAGTDRDNLTMQEMIFQESDYHYYYSYFSDLQPETKYWFAAEITDSYGTRRSDTVAFYTYGTFIDDRDNTEYKSIIIGDQIWMAENLRYEGNIPLGQTANSTNPYRYYPNGEQGNVEGYGYLYNWTATMNGESSSKMNPSGVQGICPNGWHLPSDAEWQELNNELGSGIFDDAGAQMAGEDYLWENGKLTNSYYFGTSGFSALPAGNYLGNSYGYDNFEAGAAFWSATKCSNTEAIHYGPHYTRTDNMGYCGEYYYGYSIRCLKGTTIYAAFDTVIMCADHYTYLDTTYTESGDYLRRFFYEEYADTAYSLHLDIDDCYRMVSGVITDASTGYAIPNARVVIGNAVAWTNENGEYSMSAPKGHQPLWVSAEDYATHSETVDVLQDTTFSFELYSAQISIDAEDISITTYPYMTHYDSITISNTGTTPLIWSSVADYEGIELLPESEETRHNRNSRALWDSIQTFTTQFNAEQAIATDGFFIYTSSWQRPGEFNRYTPDGEYVETFFIENVGMIRNLSYDGTYFYGTEATNVIFKLDLYNQIVVDSIITDLNSIRHCSFNRQNGKLLAGDWNSLYSIDTATGESTRIRNDLTNVYGSAFDNLSPGGPYLWLFSQTSQDNGPSAYIRQFSLSDGDFTDKAHYLDDIEITDASLAGGICASAQIMDGKYVLLANVQNPSGNNTIAVYEIGRINNMVTTDRKSGEIQPNESTTIIISEYVTETGEFNATVRYHIANVIGDQSDDLNISVSAVIPECEAVQQLTVTTDNYTVVNLNWQSVDLDIYNSVSYLVFCDNLQYAIDTTTDTSITIEGLSVGEHCFNVRALMNGDFTCISHPSETVCVNILEIPCNIPLVMDVKSEGEAITISWNSPVGADYFSIYKYNEPLAEHITETTFVDTDVVPETNYCYVLIAHFEDGVCNEISASECFTIVSGVCTEAAVLNAEVIGNTVMLEWTESNGAINYRIFRNDVFVGTTDGTSYTDKPNYAGNYCYVVESDCEYGMINLSNEECVFTDAIDEWSATELSIYPNPTSGQFFIEGQRIATVRIYNVAGQLVGEIENVEDERITVNCENWNPGLYNVQLISIEGRIATRKISISK